MNLLVIQHTPVEGPGLIAGFLSERGISHTLVASEMPLPAGSLQHASGVLVLGGPMGVYEADRHPRLRDEMTLLADAAAAGKPVLGICLGAQLLAAALGAKVYPGPAKELGWFDVTLAPGAETDPLFRSFPPVFPALHWHGDVFDLPAGARLLASSARTAHQAFAFGPLAWGLLFHLEADPEQVQAMARAFPEEVAAAGASEDALLAATMSLAPKTAALATDVFGAWLSLLPR